MSRARQYPGLILALVCLPVFIGALDLTIVSAVLPEVTAGKNGGSTLDTLNGNVLAR